MKRIIFMGMAIMAIFASSCKKEEMRAPATQKPTENPLVLIKKDVEQNGMIGDLYYNKYKPEQKVFEVQKVVADKAMGGAGLWTGTYKEGKEIDLNTGVVVEYYECDPPAADCYIDRNTIYHQKYSLK